MAKSLKKSIRAVMESAEIIDRVVHQVEARCMAADGPITPTLKEMREDELREIWLAVTFIRATLSRLETQEGK